MTPHRIANALLLLLAQLAAATAFAAAPVGVDVQRHELQLGTMKAVSGNELRIYQGETAGGDVYAMVRKARVEGTIEGDLLVAAFEIHVSGQVNRDVDATGMRLDVDGTVGSRLRASAYSVRLSGEVGADAVLFATTAALEPSSVVRGSLAIYGGEARIDGLVDGPVWIGSGKVEINGRIAGDATVTCDELVLGPAARIEGNLTYRARTPVEIPAGAVAGVVTRTEKPPEEPPAVKEGPGLFGISGQRTLFDLYLAASALIAGALMTLFFRPTVAGALDRTGSANQLAVAFGIGLVSLLALLVVGVACCLLFPLSLAVLSALAALGYFGGVVGKMVLGRWILSFTGRTVDPLIALIVGVLAVFVINLVPILGALFWFVVTVTGMGATLLQVREGARPTIDMKTTA